MFHSVHIQLSTIIAQNDLPSDTSEAVDTNIDRHGSDVSVWYLDSYDEVELVGAGDLLWRNE
eukprot:scaffold12131_cov71-Cyclotella_meneghiniana.AAC.8